MNEKLRNHINILFASAPKTAKTQEIKEELLTKLNAKHDELLAGGYDSAAAFHVALSEIGDINELLLKCMPVNNSEAKPMEPPCLPPSRPSSIPFYLGLAVGLVIIAPAFFIFWKIADAPGLGFLCMFSCWAVACGFFIYAIASSFTKGPRRGDERYHRLLLAQGEQQGLSREYVQSELRALRRENRLRQVILVLVIILLSFFTIAAVVGTANAWHKGYFTLCPVNFFINSYTPTGPIITQEREIGDFTKIRASGALSVEFKQSDKNLLVIETHEDMMQYIKTTVRGDGTLSLSTNGWFRNVKKLHITVYGRGVPLYFVASGASRVSCEEPFTTTERVALHTDGAGKLHFASLDCLHLDIEADGAGSVSVAGKATRFSCRMNGAAKLLAPDFAADTVDARLNGASRVDFGIIHQRLSVNANGASHFDYRGTPKTELKIQGASRVNAR